MSHGSVKPDVDVIYDLQGENAENAWRLICSNESLRFIQEKAERYRASKGEWLSFRVMRISTISELVPNAMMRNGQEPSLDAAPKTDAHGS